MDKQTSIVLLRVDRAAGSESLHPRHIHPPLDLKYIEAGLNRVGFTKIVLIDQWLIAGSNQSILDRVLEHHPGVVVIKAASWCLEEALEIGAKLRAKKVLTIGVGQQVSHQNASPLADWNKAYDLSIRGEPEQISVELISDLSDGLSLKEIQARLSTADGAYNLQLLEEPDSLPAPMFLKDDLTRYAFPLPIPGKSARNWGYLMTAWGCPHQCDHCSEVVRKSSGAKLRLRSPKLVVDEIESLIAKGADLISFEDDSFFSNRTHALNICSEIEKRDLKVAWMTSTRVDELDDEVIQSAKRAGLIFLKIGVESGSPEIIEAIGKSRSGDDWIGRVQNVFSQLRNRGIGTVALFMLGMPNESQSQVEDSLKLAKTIEPDYIQVQVYSDYPDVNLNLKSRSTRISGEINQYHYSAPTSSHSKIPADQLIELQISFYKKFYFRPYFVIRHVVRCWRDYLIPATLIFRTPRIARLLRYIS